MRPIAVTDPQYDAFISYSSRDLAFAEELHRRLAAERFKVWFDKRQLDPGVEWHKRIKHGCEASRVLLPVLTPNWQQSEWTKFETYGAASVIPLIVDGDQDEIFTPPLLRFQGHALNFTNGHDAWEKLFEALCDQLARTPPDKAQRIIDVRYQANPFFVGREHELNLIHERLHRPPDPTLTQARPQALTALGGTGKSTLARHYMEKFWRCYRHLFWVDCAIGVETEFARLCDLLHPEMKHITDVPEKAEQARHTLSGDEERLLVLDNAEDELSIQHWIPKSGNCRTLITSRFRKWSAAIDRFVLEVPTSEEAQTLLVTSRFRDFLYDGLPRPPYKPNLDGGLAPSYEQLPGNEQSSCTTLAETLGRLPLALEQAAAYMANEDWQYTFADYVSRYEETTKQLLAEHVLGSTEYPDSVLTTWTMTTAKLSAGARGIMRLMSFVSPTPMPLDVLAGGLEHILNTAQFTEESAIPNPPSAIHWVREQVKQIKAYSMAAGDGRSLTFHPLVQTVERLHLAKHHDATLQRSLAWINAAVTADWDDVLATLKLDPLTGHGESVARHADEAKIPAPTARLMSCIAEIHRHKAQYNQAEPLLRRALAINEQSYGAEHPNVARDLNNLAALLQATNRLAEAEPLMRRALAIDEQSFGDQHPRVAIDLNNLALLLQATNRLAQAEPLMRRALAIDEQSFGDQHPKVAIRLNNLAQLLKATNRLAEAEPLMRRALAIDEQSYEAEHPRIAIRLNTLAQLLQDTNRLAEAEPLMRRALAIDEQPYGAEHPNVARDLNNLAALLQATNRLAEAEPLMRRALAIDEQSYGDQHPNVARDLSNMATLLQATNRLAEAESLMRRGLAIDEQSYGAEHPNVAIDLNNVAQLLKATNRLAEAEPLMRRALAIDEQSYGAEHPDVAVNLNNLAQLLQATNRLAEAEPLMRRALAIFEQSYGADHPNVATSLNNLALLLHATNRLAEAEPLMRRMVEIFVQFGKATGHQHPHLKLVLRNYSLLLEEIGLDEAEISRRLSEIGS